MAMVGVSEQHVPAPRHSEGGNIIPVRMILCARGRRQSFRGRKWTSSRFPIIVGRRTQQSYHRRQNGPARQSRAEHRSSRCRRLRVPRCLRPGQVGDVRLSSSPCCRSSRGRLLFSSLSPSFPLCSLGASGGQDASAASYRAVSLHAGADGMPWPEIRAL